MITVTKKHYSERASSPNQGLLFELSVTAETLMEAEGEIDYQLKLYKLQKSLDEAAANKATSEEQREKAFKELKAFIR